MGSAAGPAHNVDSAGAFALTLALSPSGSVWSGTLDKPRYTDFELPVTVAGIRFRNPFYVASGPTAMTIEQLRRIRDTGWGGASLKLTVYPIPYINRRPRYHYHNEAGYLAFTAEKRLTLDELLGLIDGITPEDVARAASEYFDADRQFTLRLGP